MKQTCLGVHKLTNAAWNLFPWAKGDAYVAYYRRRTTQPALNKMVAICPLHVNSATLLPITRFEHNEKHQNTITHKLYQVLITQ